MTWITGYQKWLSETESLNNASMVFAHFAGSDWTKESLAAMCGNMRHESSLNPDMYEYGYDWTADRGYGLVQWTPRSKFWNWATSEGLDPRHGDTQLKRIDYEITNNIQWIPKSSFDYLTFSEFRTNARNWDIDALTAAFTWGYERPNQTAGETSMLARRAFAHRCFNELDFTGSYIWFIFPTVERVTSGFRTADRPDHYGVDFAESGYHEIHASADGVVSRSDVSATYGEVVYILHNLGGQEYETVYAHMQTGSRTVSLGDTVKQGDVIGIMGNTGDSEGQHLHFELHVGRWNLNKTNAIDPLTMLGKSFTGSDPSSEKHEISIFHLWLSKALPNWSG